MIESYKVARERLQVLQLEAEGRHIAARGACATPSWSWVGYSYLRNQLRVGALPHPNFTLEMPGARVGKRVGLGGANARRLPGCIYTSLQ